VDAFRTPSVDAVHVALPACADREIEGIVVNFQGQAQRLRRAVRPTGFQEPVWLWMRNLGRRFGLAGSETAASAVFDRVAAEVPAFAGMSYRNLGPLGRKVR
jgi:predicted molibdopterin-dependent oxidoreductase YjgC